MQIHFFLWKTDETIKTKLNSIKHCGLSTALTFSPPPRVSSFSSPVSLIDVLPKGDFTREMKTIRLDLAQLPRDVM